MEDQKDSKPVAATSRPAPRPLDESDFSRNLNFLNKTWPDIIKRMGKVSQVAPLLKDSKPLRVEEHIVVIGFDPEFAEEIDQLKYPRTRHVVQTVLSQFLKRKVNVCFEVLESPAGLPSDHGSDGKAGASSATGQHPMERWLSDPKIQLVLEAFSATISDVRE